MKKIIIMLMAISMLLISCSTPNTPSYDDVIPTSSNPSGGNPNTPNGDTTSSNPQPYTVTFVYGESLVDSQTVTVAPNDKITPPANPTKEGYVFDYWYIIDESTRVESKYDFTSTINSNITLYAKWRCMYIIVNNNEYNTIGNNLSPTSLTFKIKCIDTAEIQTVTHITTTSMYAGFTPNTYNGNIHFTYIINNNKITFSLSNNNNSNVLNQFELYDVSRNENDVTIAFRNKQ